MLTLVFSDGEHLSSMILEAINSTPSSPNNTSEDSTSTLIAGLNVARYNFENSDFEIQLEGTLHKLTGFVSNEDWYGNGDSCIILHLDESSYEEYTFDNESESVTLSIPSSFFILSESDLESFSENQITSLENGNQLSVIVDINNFGLEAKIGSESGHNKGEIIFTSIE